VSFGGKNENNIRSNITESNRMVSVRRKITSTPDILKTMVVAKFGIAKML
jgi:hypothetical protein